MNILDFKRKALGYTFRGESDYDTSSLYDVRSKYITVAGGFQGDDSISIPNPNYIPPSTYENQRAKIAASLGVPVSSVEPQYGTKMGGA